MLGFDLTRILQGCLRSTDQRADLFQQAFGGHGTPVGSANFLGDVMHHLALALLGDQETVRLLLGTHVGKAEIKYVPGKSDIVGAAPFVLRDRVGR